MGLPMSMKIPKKEDFYDQNNKLYAMEVEYSLKKYLGKDEKNIIESFQEYSAYAFLDDLKYMGGKAFCYYVRPLIKYLIQESNNWNEHFYDEDKKYIDDDAPLAYTAIPVILNFRLSWYSKEYKACFVEIIDFLEWVIEHHDNFYPECFHEDNIKLQYEHILLMMSKIIHQ